MIVSLLISYAFDHNYGANELAETLKVIEANRGTDKLLEDFSGYLLTVFASELDLLPPNYDLLTHSEKADIAKNIWKGSAATSQLLAKTVPNYSQIQLQNQVAKFLQNKGSNSNQALIQTPTPLSSATKSAIRKSLASNFVRFNIQKDLLSGIKLYQNEQLTDTTLRGRLEQLTHLL